jgi:hypothetical protein
LVRRHHRASGPVHKARLDVGPGRHEAYTVVCRQRPDAQPFDSLCAVLERGFRVAPVAALLDGSRIFSVAELTPQSRSPAFPVPKERDQACNEEHDESNG